jgi:hypothetical protein
MGKSCQQRWMENSSERFAVMRLTRMGFHRFDEIGVFGFDFGVVANGFNLWFPVIKFKFER